MWLTAFATKKPKYKECFISQESTEKKKIVKTTIITDFQAGMYSKKWSQKNLWRSLNPTVHD